MSGMAAFVPGAPELDKADKKDAALKVLRDALLTIASRSHDYSAQRLSRQAIEEADALLGSE